jgi:hypothetical protein
MEENMEPHTRVSVVPWHGWQSVSASYGAQIGSERQRHVEMSELNDECEREAARIEITISEDILTKVVAEFWSPTGRRVHRRVKWFLRSQTACDWADGVSARWEREYAGYA